MVTLLGLIDTPRTVRLAAYAGDGADGPTFGPAVTVPARIERVMRQVQQQDGRVVTLAALVTLPATVSVHVGDRIEIDDERRRVEVVDTPVFFDGSPMHHEVGVS